MERKAILKRSILLLLMVLCWMPAFGQGSIGVRAKWSLLGNDGPSAGLVFHWTASEECPAFIQGGLEYSYLKSSIATSKASLTHYCQSLSVPVIAGYELCDRRVRLGAGTDISHILAKKTLKKMEGQPDEKYPDSSLFNRNYAQVLFNVEYLPKPFIGLSAGYSLGIPVSDNVKFATVSYNSLNLAITIYL